MNLILPDWDAPTRVRAFMTTRNGGVSLAAYGDVKGVNGLNPATHVGDDGSHVRANRALICAQLPSEPFWLNQTHSTTVWQFENGYDAAIPPNADAVVLTQIGQVGVVMTADCLPVIFASADGAVVGAAHAGWRGLVDGVLAHTIAAMVAKGAVASEIHVWLGAAIGATAFEVGQDVLDEFTRKIPADVQPFFVPQKNGKYLADIYGLARQRLALCGVMRVSGGVHCTVSEPEQFYSYRRDRITGRMATCIWLDAL